MQATLLLHEYHYDGPLGGPPIETLEVTLNEDTRHKPAITFWIDRPSTLQVYMLQAEVVPGFTVLGPLGRVDCTGWLYPSLSSHTYPWVWWLPSSDLTRLESLRAGSTMTLTLRCSGIAQKVGTSQLIPVKGDAVVGVASSDWERILRAVLDYQPKRWLELPLESAHWPEWQTAVDQLQEARRALALGETHRALWHCLHLLEGWKTPADQSGKQPIPPYTPAKWKGLFDVDDNTDAGLQNLIAGIAYYLNKVGHHRSRTELDEHGNWKESPVDHYEAEVLVSMTQLLVAYLARLPRKA